jgi:integrase
LRHFDNYVGAVRAKKTNIETSIKLPDYAVDIISKYKTLKTLLPKFNKSNLNKYIKILLEKAGFSHPVNFTREKRGQNIDLNLKPGRNQNETRFCDLATTHTMRRTAITTMLSLGLPEQLVRRISGHAAGSKEFYRYVKFSQNFQDQETDNAFKKLTSLPAI